MPQKQSSYQSCLGIDIPIAKNRNWAARSSGAFEISNLKLGANVTVTSEVSATARGVSVQAPLPLEFQILQENGVEVHSF